MSALKGIAAVLLCLAISPFILLFVILVLVSVTGKDIEALEGENGEGYL